MMNTYKITVTAMIACAALIGGATSAHAITFDFETDALGNAIAPGEVVDFEYQNDGLTVYTYSNAHPSQSMGISYANSGGRGLAVSNLASPASPESAGGHFIFALGQSYNDGNIDFQLSSGAVQIQYVLNGALVGVTDLTTSNSVGLGSLGDYDTLAVVFTGFGWVNTLTVDNNSGSSTTVVANPEPITATLSLMGIAALGTTVLGRRRRVA